MDIRVKALSFWLGAKAKGMRGILLANSEDITEEQEKQWRNQTNTEWDDHLAKMESGASQRPCDGIEDIRHAALMQEDGKSGVFAKAVEDVPALQEAECDHKERIDIIKSLIHLAGVSMKALTQAHGHLVNRRQAQLKKDAQETQKLAKQAA